MRISLSGGGARSAFQAGVLEALVEAGFEIDEIMAISGGVINGYILKVHGMDVLREFWLEVMPERGRMVKWYAGIPWNVIRRRKGLMNPDFIMGLVKEYVTEIPKDLFFDVVSLFDGEQKTLSGSDFGEDLESYREGIYASMAIPILFPPVDIPTESGNVMDCSDGGLYYPLSEATFMSDLKITTHYPEKEYGRVKGVFDAVMKVVGFRRDEGLDRLFNESNKVEPIVRIPGVWDWDPDSLLFSYYHGKDVGRMYLDNIEE